MARVTLVAVVLIGCGRVGFATSDDAQLADSIARICTTESFSVLPAEWETWTEATGFMAVVTNGQVEIQLSTVGAAYAGINTLAGVDFTGAEISVEVTSVVGPMNVENYLSVYAGTMNGYTIYFEENAVKTARATMTESMTPYQAQQHRYWRIEHDPARDMVVYSTSGDRVTWNELYAVPPTIPLTAMQFELSAGTYNGGAAQPGVARYDNFQRCLAP